jgi:hypothetical protein
MRDTNRVKPVSDLKAGAVGAQETSALLEILSLGTKDVAAGRVKPVAEVVARLRAKRPGS